MFENSKEFDTKRKKEFAFFISELQKLGDMGLRPHQAYIALLSSSKISDKDSTKDPFYWEGVYGPEFDEEALSDGK